MADILHRVAIEGTAPDKVYDALTTLDGLSGWWIERAAGNPGNGGTIEYPHVAGLALKVAELNPGKLVRWEVTGGPAEWVGTTIQFGLHQDGDWTVILFKHQDWREPVEFMHHCSTRWATVLLSLKQFVETGTGANHPQVTIGNWE